MVKLESVALKRVHGENIRAAVSVLNATIRRGFSFNQRVEYVWFIGALSRERQIAAPVIFH